MIIKENIVCHYWQAEASTTFKFCDFILRNHYEMYLTMKSHKSENRLGIHKYSSV